MRTSKISKVVVSSETKPFVYVPVNMIFANVDGETRIVAQDQRVVMRDFRVRDFRIQTMLDAGISQEEIVKRGCSLLTLDPFDVVSVFDSLNS